MLGIAWVEVNVKSIDTAAFATLVDGVIAVFVNKAASVVVTPIKH